VVGAILLASCASAAGSSTPTTQLGVADPPPASATSAAGANTAPRTSRALLVGDSTLLAIEKYNAFDSLRDFDYVYDAKSCRTLGIVSCGLPPKPSNSVGAIQDADGTFDVVVIMAGYDEWWTSFPSSFNDVVAAARAKGAMTVLWLTYREDVTYENPQGVRAAEAYVKNNATLRAKTARPEFSDVTLLDWDSYTAPVPSWLANDGIHLTLTGAHGLGDYISRMIAHLDGRPCPDDDGSTSVCPDPDDTGPT
jgi:hypothetical protein